MYSPLLEASREATNTGVRVLDFISMHFFGKSLFECIFQCLLASLNAFQINLGKSTTFISSSNKLIDINLPIFRQFNIWLDWVNILSMFFMICLPDQIDFFTNFWKS